MFSDYRNIFTKTDIEHKNLLFYFIAYDMPSIVALI